MNLEANSFDCPDEEEDLEEEVEDVEEDEEDLEEEPIYEHS